LLRSSASIPAPLRLSINPSRLIRLYMLCSVSLANIALCFLPVGWEMKILSLIALQLAVLITIAYRFWVGDLETLILFFPFSIVISGELVKVETRGGLHIHGKLGAKHFSSSKLILLELKDDTLAKHSWLPIPADSVSAEEFRQLQLNVKFG